MAKAISVDELCSFGAKNFQRWGRFIQDGSGIKSDDPASAGHFPGGVTGQCFLICALESEALHIGASLGLMASFLFVFTVKGLPIAGMLPFCRLASSRSGCVPS